MKKMKRSQRRKKSPASTTKAKNKKVSTVSYTITSSEPIRDIENDFPKSVEDQLDSLFFMINSKPKQAIEQLLVLKETYPNAPKIYNFLSAAYGRLSNIDTVID